MSDTYNAFPKWHYWRDYRIVRLWLRLRWGARCDVCQVPSWLNPPADHAEWVGHRWVR